MDAKIDLRHMRAFLAIAEERNFTRAALRSHISQSALSKQIRTVETELGTKVFDRQTRQVVLTKAGRVFKREAIRTLEHSHRAISLVQAIVKAEEEPIHIGISMLTDRSRLHYLLEKAEKSVAGISTEVHSGYTPALLQSVLRGHYDAAIVDLPIHANGLRMVPLYSEPLVAAFPEKLAFAKQSVLTLADLTRVPLVLLAQNADPARPFIERSLRKSGSTIYKIRDAGNLIELLDQVVLENRTALVRASTQRLERTGLLYRPLTDSMALECVLVWRSENRHGTLLSLLNAIHAFNQSPDAP
jgi:LysR family hca operon transcriptional activator